eukprot:m.132294 g.132294  ORF g.132294 m.132294 type:complete len:57 (+) comp13931_c3_seq1:2109-2279(+)
MWGREPASLSPATSNMAVVVVVMVLVDSRHVVYGEWRLKSGGRRRAGGGGKRVWLC